MKENLHVGDVVLIKDNSLGTPHWPLAMVVKAFPGKDGLVRVVELKCGNGRVTRPVVKLVLLLPSDRDPAARPPVDVRAH